MLSRPESIGRTGARRPLFALAAGIVLALGALFASQFVPQVLLGLPLRGGTLGLVGIFQVLLVPAAVALALRLAGLTFRDVGLVRSGWRREALIGAGLALAFALLQFGLVIPATGGADRSDVLANSAQIGKSFAGLAGVILLAWTGGLAEELLFRGHVLPLLRALLGGGWPGTATAVAGTAALFGALHGYQGWAGVIDTGLYGGLALSLIYVWRGRLVAPIVAHAMWNMLAGVVIFLWY